MIDRYFLKSLAATLAVYLLCAGVFVLFVLITGIAGVSLLFALIVLLLTYFYGAFDKIPPGRGKGRRE